MIDTRAKTHLTLSSPSELNELVELMNVESELIAILLVWDDLLVILLVEDRYPVNRPVIQLLQVLLGLTHRDQVGCVQYRRRSFARDAYFDLTLELIPFFGLGVGYKIDFVFLLDDE